MIHRKLLVAIAGLLLLPCARAQDEDPSRGFLFDDSWWLRRAFQEPWALAHVNVVDVATGDVQEDVTILVKGDLLSAVGPGPAPEGVEVVDGAGAWVIPGLFDLHAHVIPPSPRFPGTPPAEDTLRALIDAGVTTIRLLPLLSEDAQLWRARVNLGELVGPTIVPAGGLMEKEPQRTTRGFGDPATAVAWVRKEALLGARWIKVYSSMDEPSLRAIVAAADELGLRVGGHATGVPPMEAVRIGQDTLEHTIDWPASCLREGREPAEGGMIDRAAANWAGYDERRGTELMELMKERGAAWVPTLVVADRIVELGGHDGRPANDADAVRAFAAGLDVAAREAVRMHERGGLVGLGTDFPVDGVAPGTSVHDELRLLVERGGATPLEALRIGTLDSARILGLSDVLGTVEAGKIASFVVLAANPLEDVENAARINLVVHDGRPHHPH